MKTEKFLLVVLLALSALFMAYGEASAKLPSDFQDFKARFEKEARTEQGAVKIFFEAIYCYMNPATRDEASKMLRFALYDSQPIENAHTRATFVERMKDESTHYIFKSYAAGATPENNYNMSPDNFKLEFTGTRADSGGGVTLFVRSSGADSPRPVSLTKYDGLWHISSFSSIYTQVRAPKSTADARRMSIDADNDVKKQ